jgi:hypothetical protein
VRLFTAVETTSARASVAGARVDPGRHRWIAGELKKLLTIPTKKQSHFQKNKKSAHIHSNLFVLCYLLLVVCPKLYVLVNLDSLPTEMYDYAQNPEYFVSLSFKAVDIFSVGGANREKRARVDVFSLHVVFALCTIRAKNCNLTLK